MAVNIWEGNKAQALIDAIASNEKISKQQGTGNSGKVLVVGSDGDVVPTYNILPDAVKNALMDCFSHVIWDSDKGESTYGKALRDALYDTSPSPTPTSGLVYELPSGVDANYFSTNTGVEVFDTNAGEEFTILVKGTWEKAIVDNAVAQSFVLDARSSSNGVMVRIQTDISNDGTTVAFRSTYAQAGGSTQRHSVDGTYNVVFIQRYSSNILTIKTYVDGVLEYSFNNTVTHIMVPGSDYAIGNNHTKGLSKTFTGSYDFIKIYDTALSDEEIATIVGVSG